jgi:hypothetical protein
MLIPKPKVTVERLREVLSYDPDTGRLKWEVRISCHNSGEHAGCVKMDGYVYVNLDKNRMFGHRIAWALHYGAWPTHQIDHINGTRSDNRIANLREATNSLNQHNRRDMVRKNGGLKGTSFNKKHGQWKAEIVIEKKLIRLGLFNSEAEAHAAYADAKAKAAKLERAAPPQQVDESGLPG